MGGPEHPAVDRIALRKIWIKGGTELTVPAGGLLTTLRLAVERIHLHIPQS